MPQRVFPFPLDDNLIHQLHHLYDNTRTKNANLIKLSTVEVNNMSSSFSRYVDLSEELTSYSPPFDRCHLLKALWTSRLLSSGVWELTAEAGKRFVVHEDVLASQSQRLKDIIDAFTAVEPHPGREIPLDNWDADTVGRFVEYIYTGDYQSPDPVLPSTPAMTPERSDQSLSSGGQSPTDTASAPSAPEQVEEGRALEAPIRPLTPLSECFPDGPDPLQKLSAAETFAAKYFDPSEHDFEGVFLAHAKVFALAWEFDVETLQKLAVQRLLRTFINIGSFQSDWPVASNFVELARYSYCGNNPGDNDLRKIVSQFAALNFTALQTDEMKVLIEQSGGFARDVTGKVCRRLIIAENDRDHEQKAREGLKLRLRSTRTELKEEREKSVGLEEMIEKVVERKASPFRPPNPLADRKPSKNTVSISGGTLFPPASIPPEASANIPPSPPKSLFPVTNTATTGIFGYPPVTDPSPSLAVKIPAGGALFPASSQPGSKSIFDTPTSASGLFTGSGTKFFFDTDKTPSKTKTSGSYGFFYTPPMSRSSSALAPVPQTPEIGSSIDPIKQPTPSPSLFRRPSGNTSAFARPPSSTSALDSFGPLDTSLFGPRPSSNASDFRGFGASSDLSSSSSLFGGTRPTQKTGSLFGGGAKATPAVSAGGSLFGKNSAAVLGSTTIFRG